jgi:hypothetical protein
MKLKKILSNPWFVSTGSGLIIIASPPIITSIIKKINLFDSLKFIYKFSFNLIINFLSLKIQLWQIILILFFIIVIIKTINLIKINKKPDWYYTYRKDTFNNNLYNWNYELNVINKKYEIYNINQICKSCECILSYESQFHLYCPNCSKKYQNLLDKIDDIQTLIIYRINNELYKKPKNDT